MDVCRCRSFSVNVYFYFKVPKTVLLHQLFQLLLNEDWKHPDKLFAPPNTYYLFYTHLEENFVKKKSGLAPRPRSSFLRKVVSAFHLQPGHCSSSLCLASVHLKEISLHCLDVVQTVRINLSATPSFRNANFLFCLSGCSP